MTYGEAARQVFGAEAVTRFADVAAYDARHHLAAGNFLTAAFSAGHAVRLSGQMAWAAEDQDRMASVLLEEVRLGLEAKHDADAAERAASYQMLMGQTPWAEAELERFQKALADMPGRRHAYDSVALAHQVADYLLLGGLVVWAKEELHEMRTAVIVDFKHCVEESDGVLAADRLVIFDVLESCLEGFAVP